MHNRYNVLILGASYGSLLATKVLLAGHDVTLVCRLEEAQVINERGTRVRLPVKGREAPVEIDSRRLPGTLAAATPEAVTPAGYDLVALAMQEPQYRVTVVRRLLAAVAAAKIPCMSIMNMPPLPFLARIRGLDVDALTPCYTDHTVWSGFAPALMTLCSPDPQAFRPPDEGPNVLQVTLPTNFKAARFGADEHTAMLRRLQADIEAVRFDAGDGPVALPVKLKVHDSIFVPLAKWSMLLAGNYRCIRNDGPRSIRDAVHDDLARTRSVYDWVGRVCKALGATDDDLVPFEKYANAAKGLVKPSSFARALFAGAPNIERVDCLVRTIAAQHGLQCAAVDEIVALVDARLDANRLAA